MSVTQPTAAEIIAGPAQIWIAPVGTVLPTNLTGSPAVWPPNFAAPWVSPGYTDKGVDLIITPTIKPYTPDEERSPVYDIAQAEKAEISFVLAQGTLDNFAKAISASLLTGFSGKQRKLSHGNLALQYFAVAVTGPSPSDPDASGTNVGLGVVCYMQKAIAMSPITFAMTRQGVRLFSVKFDARKIAGQDLATTIEVIQ